MLPLAWLLNLLLLLTLVVEEVSSVADLPDTVLHGDTVSHRLGGMCPLLQDEVVRVS